MKRCAWCNLNNPIYVKYHDEEWGVAKYDDHELFELLILEMFHCGLSWEIILNKRSNFREAFDNFEIEKIMNYQDDEVSNLLQNKNIVRNKLKIKAAIDNAKIFREMQKEYGSFCNYIWSYIDGKTLYIDSDVVKNDLSDTISKDLQKRGMKFVGSVVIYSYLQAIGVINSHSKDCFKYNVN